MSESLIINLLVQIIAAFIEPPLNIVTAIFIICAVLKFSKRMILKLAE